MWKSNDAFSEHSQVETKNKFKMTIISVVVNEVFDYSFCIREQKIRISNYKLNQKNKKK